VLGAGRRERVVFFPVVVAEARGALSRAALSLSRARPRRSLPPAATCDGLVADVPRTPVRSTAWRGGRRRLGRGAAERQGAGGGAGGFRQRRERVADRRWRGGTRWVVLWHRPAPARTKPPVPPVPPAQ
jgi:hypothetical protein